MPSEPSSVTVIKDCAGRYFLSFVVEVEPESIPDKNQGIGVDLGLKTFAVMSDGVKHTVPTTLNQIRLHRDYLDIVPIIIEQRDSRIGGLGLRHGRNSLNTSLS